MKDNKRYKKAPIKEAILNINFEGLNIDSVEDLKNFHSEIKDQFTVSKTKFNFKGEVVIKKDKVNLESKSKSEVVGYIFNSKDEKRHLQISQTSFTLNFLEYYYDWEEFSELAFKIFKKFKKKYSLKEINSIGLRYINRIKIPLNEKGVKFEDYITNMPPIPKCLPQTFRNFFLQTESPLDKKGKVNAKITETLEKNHPNTFLPFILDIDVFVVDNIDSSQKNIKKSFSSLRDYKNQIFEDCITDKTRDLFQ